MYYYDEKMSDEEFSRVREAYDIGAGKPAASAVG